MFLLDGSKTLGKAGFAEVKNFVLRMIDSYEVSPQNTHIGVLEFSEKARIRIPLNKTFNPKELKSLVKEIEPSNKDSRNIDLAFKFAEKELLPPEGGSRPNVTRVMVLVTAGRSTGSLPLKYATKPFRDDGVRIYVVSIGDKTDERELKNVVDDEKDIHKVKAPKETPTVVMKVVHGIKKDIKKGTIWCPWCYFIRQFCCLCHVVRLCVRLLVC